jgi:hypothetical protein
MQHSFVTDDGDYNDDGLDYVIRRSDMVGGEPTINSITKDDSQLFLDENAVYGDPANAREVFAEELGEGIYVRSGEAISIREAYYTDDDGDNDSIPRGGGSTGEPCHVVSGGGFAVLQECSPVTGGSNIIIEKVGKPRLTTLLSHQVDR